MEIPDPKNPFLSRLTKFQQCIFKRIHWILIAPDGQTKISNIRSLCVKVHCIAIEYENGKAKPTHHLVQLINLDDTNDQCQEWLLE